MSTGKIAYRARPGSKSRRCNWAVLGGLGITRDTPAAQSNVMSRARSLPFSASWLSSTQIARPPDRASDVLFATTIAEALRRFNCLGVGHLVNVLDADEKTPWKCPPPGEAQLPGTLASESRLLMESRIAAANSVLETIREWARSGVLDSAQVPALALRVASRLVDSDWADDA